MGPEMAEPLAANPAIEEAGVSTDRYLQPDFLPRLLATQASYRFLVSSGLTGVEAAGVIAYVTGIGAGTGRWSLSQVNRMLFLRNLYTGTAWGQDERRPA
jgi:hypothetical protein